MYLKAYEEGIARADVISVWRIPNLFKIFFSSITSLVNQTRSLGENLKYRKVVQKILKSLTSKFDFVVAAIEEYNDLTIFSINQLMYSLQAHGDNWICINSSWEGPGIKYLKKGSDDGETYPSVLEGNRNCTENQLLKEVGEDARVRIDGTKEKKAINDKHGSQIKKLMMFQNQKRKLKQCDSREEAQWRILSFMSEQSTKMFIVALFGSSWSEKWPNQCASPPRKTSCVYVQKAPSKVRSANSEVWSESTRFGLRGSVGNNSNRFNPLILSHLFGLFIIFCPSLNGKLVLKQVGWFEECCMFSGGVSFGVQKGIGVGFAQNLVCWVAVYRCYQSVRGK